MPHDNLPSPSPVLFPKGTHLRHIKSDGTYIIEDTPDENRLEHNGEPAYGYRDTATRQKWQRSQVEMEDGRFRIADDS